VLLFCRGLAKSRGGDYLENYSSGSVSFELEIFTLGGLMKKVQCKKVPCFTTGFIDYQEYCHHSGDFGLQM